MRERKWSDWVGGKSKLKKRRAIMSGLLVLTVALGVATVAVKVMWRGQEQDD